ncbi:equilibrative nucleobase transporter 1-like [Clavelina lepadiformis]|uniref:equilibrative nucleobase transporter 1-like n=1 Tax=Clavelina lepadiformis TaxID=159417 RepID=UPI004042C7C5
MFMIYFFLQYIQWSNSSLIDYCCDMRVKHVLTTITAVLETLCLSGIIFGWGSLSFILQKEGYFSSMCNGSARSSNASAFSSTCKPQQEELHLTFTIASVSSSFLITLIGYIYDRFGSWTVRCCVSVLYISAFLTMAWTDETHSWLLFLTMPAIAVSGLTVLLTNIPVSNLFSTHRALVVSLVNGAFDSSAFVFVFAKLAYSADIPFTYILYFLASCGILPIIRTFFLMPRHHIPLSVPDDYQYGLNDCLQNTESEEEASNNIYENLNDISSVSLKECVFSLGFCLNVAFVSILQLRNQFIYGTLDAWLNYILPSHEAQQSVVINVFGVVQVLGIVVSPFCGVFIDAMQKRFADSNSSQVNTKATSAGFAVTSFLAVLFSIFVLIPSVPLLFVAFLLQTTFRSFLYTVFSTYLITCFPEKHFGKLYGLTTLLASSITLLQFPLFYIVMEIFDGNFFVINMVLLFLTLLTFIHPIVLYIRPYQSQFISNRFSLTDE